MSMVMDSEMFGEWLQKEINARDWSEAKLARLSGLTRQAINNYINARVNNPDKSALQKIAKAFGYDVEDVYREAGLLPKKIEADPLKDRIDYLLDRLPENKREEILAMVEFMYDREHSKNHDTKPRMAEG
jgi:transcriptional regulator with XRE-family HTH domain